MTDLNAATLNKICEQYCKTNSLIINPPRNLGELGPILTHCEHHCDILRTNQLLNIVQASGIGLLLLGALILPLIIRHKKNSFHILKLIIIAIGIICYIIPLFYMSPDFVTPLTPSFLKHFFYHI